MSTRCAGSKCSWHRLYHLPEVGAEGQGLHIKKKELCSGEVEGVDRGMIAEARAGSIMGTDRSQGNQDTDDVMCKQSKPAPTCL